MFCLWGTTPEATSLMTAAWTRVVWTPFRLSCPGERLKWSMYRARAFSSSRVRISSSRVPSTAASQARTRSAVCWLWWRPDCRREAVSSSKWVSGSSTAMAASRASSMSRSAEARSSSAAAFPVDVGGVQGEPVPELAEQGLLLLGEDAVGHGVQGAKFPALLQGLVDGGAVPEGPAGDFGQGEPEGLLIEGVGPGGCGGQLDRFLEADVVGPAAAGM